MAKLTLIPTPIASGLPLEPVAWKLLNENCLSDSVVLLVEELREARRMWSGFGLPREAFEKMIEFNEHTQEQLGQQMLVQLKAGKDIYLLSDCGLPAFCDPGQKLVELCHQSNIQVTSTPFPNSIALSVALSGFDASEFLFAGFISNKADQRQKHLGQVVREKRVTIVMDTPYRFNKLVDEMAELAPDREAFLGINLNAENEQCVRAPLRKLAQKLVKQKCEFVLVLGPL